MSEQEDKQLHDWVRQSLDNYRPAYNPADWEEIQPILRRRRWTIRGTILGGILALLSLLGWFLTRNDAPDTKVVVRLTTDKSVPGTNSASKPVPSAKAMAEKRSTHPLKNSKSGKAAFPMVGEKMYTIAAAPSAYINSIGEIKPLQNGLTSYIQPPRIVEFSPEEIDITNQIQTDNFGTDSTSYRILDRNLRKWPDAVIVCDLTSSMYPYTTQIFAWLKKQTRNPAIKGIVFFTDCDSLGHQTRPNGPAGQMFITRERKGIDVLPVLLAAARNTVQNKDDAENDIEALLAAQNSFPEARHLILVADNISTVKDMPLLNQVRKPVHVVLCGTTGSDTIRAFQTDYYTIASQTNGSLHTLEDDLIPTALTRNTTLRVGSRYYRYVPRKQRFKPTSFDHRPKRILNFIWL
ncbi:hypothetical protein GCM10028805_09160 [Spirosoma harenae]